MKKFVLLCAALLSLGAAAGTASASPVSRSNAVRTAHDYLQSEPLSYKSLIEQLKFEGYSTGDATYAVSHSGANWYREAVLDAKQYLQSEPFSGSGLIEQLGSRPLRPFTA